MDKGHHNLCSQTRQEPGALPNVVAGLSNREVGIFLGFFSTLITVKAYTENDNDCSYGNSGILM